MSIPLLRRAACVPFVCGVHPLRLAPQHWCERLSLDATVHGRLVHRVQRRLHAQRCRVRMSATNSPVALSGQFNIQSSMVCDDLTCVSVSAFGIDLLSIGKLMWKTSPDLPRELLAALQDHLPARINLCGYI